MKKDKKQVIGGILWKLLKFLLLLLWKVFLLLLWGCGRLAEVILQQFNRWLKIMIDH